MQISIAGLNKIAGTFVGFGLVFLIVARPVAAIEVGTGDGLVMRLDESGQVTALSAGGLDLLSSGKTGGFQLREYHFDPGPELLKEGGFDRPGGFRMSGGWHRDTTVARSGGASLCLDVARKGELLIDIPLEPDAVYLVTFYMKTKDLEGTPILHIRRRDSQGKLIGRQANIEYLGIYHPDWRRLQHTFQTLPGTSRGELMFHVVYGALRGRIWIDDFSIRQLRLTPFTTIKGTVSPDRDGGVLFQAETSGIKLEASIRGLAEHITISGVLQDVTGNERCVQLLYRLPLDAEGWRWQRGLSSADTIEPGRTYTNATEIGRSTNRYISPWPYSSIDGPEVGLSLGAAIDHPSVYRMWYDEEGYWCVCFDFGLSQQTKKFPGRAEFALTLSLHDPRWGMRAAAKKYFTLFPRFFEARTNPGATIQNRLNAEIRGLEDFGAMYADRHGGDVSWIKLANDAGMYTMTYNEPWMWRSRLPEKIQPDMLSVEGILARQRRDIVLWDTNDSNPDYRNVPRAYSVRAFLNSVFHDEFGNPVTNGIRTYSSGRQLEWLTNADPEIVGAYGKPNRGMLSWIYEYGRDREGAQKIGGRANGIRYDSLSEWVHLGAENFRQEHFAFADFPLTFSYRTAKPCQLGYFCALEYMIFVRREMLKTNGITYANGGVGVPWFCWLLDGISREGWRPEIEGYQRIRMLMYQKTCGDWGGGRLSRLSDLEMERRLNTCLTYAWWPGLDGASQAVYDKKRPLFKKYIPVLKSLARSGWEPVTYAVAEPEGTIIERFGGNKGRRLFFTVRNIQPKPATISVTVDAEALGLDLDQLRVRDVLADKEITALKINRNGTISFFISAPAQTTVVLEIG